MEQTSTQPILNKRQEQAKLRNQYVKDLKRIRDEYSAQNKQFVKILEYYANGPNGELATAALDAWNARIEEVSPLHKYYLKHREDELK